VFIGLLHEHVRSMLIALKQEAATGEFVDEGSHLVVGSDDFDWAHYPEVFASPVYLSITFQPEKTAGAQGGPLRERETDSHIDIHKENPQMVEALIILGPTDCVYLLWNGMFELVGSSAVIIIIMSACCWCLVFIGVHAQLHHIQTFQPPCVT
jgi:hypothetical protein